MSDRGEDDHAAAEGAAEMASVHGDYRRSSPAQRHVTVDRKGAATKRLTVVKASHQRLVDAVEEGRAEVAGELRVVGGTRLRFVATAIKRGHNHATLPHRTPLEVHTHPRRCRAGQCIRDGPSHHDLQLLRNNPITRAHLVYTARAVYVLRPRRLPLKLPLEKDVPPSFYVSSK